MAETALPIHSLYQLQLRTCEMIHLLNQLVADWSAVADGPVASQPRVEQPVASALASMNHLFNSVWRSWAALFVTTADASGDGALGMGTSRRRDR